MTPPPTHTHTSSTHAHTRYPSSRRKFHKLYYLYKPGVYYWIIIILLRKLGLALTSLMFRSNPAFQLSMSLLVTFYSYVLQVAYRPYLCLGESAKVLKDHRKKVGVVLGVVAASAGCVCV